MLSLHCHPVLVPLRQRRQQPYQPPTMFITRVFMVIGHIAQHLALVMGQVLDIQHDHGTGTALAFKSQSAKY